LNPTIVCGPSFPWDVQLTPGGSLGGGDAALGLVDVMSLDPFVFWSFCVVPGIQTARAMLFLSKQYAAPQR